MNRALAILIGAFVLLAGCDDTTAPRDLKPPAAPRGLYSTTGDHSVVLEWLPNTEHDVAGYRVYTSVCASGPECPYERIGTTTDTRYVVSGLANGATRYFAVAAYDYRGNESALSYEDVYDTPRPEGFGLVLRNALDSPETSGYDFSAYAILPFDDQGTDVYFATAGGVPYMFAPFTDTDIQDAGYARTLDAVDYAPDAGWSPSGSVELILGHCYVVWTHDDHYAKFRVTAVSDTRVTVDWAYQVDTGNRELRQRATGTGPRVRRPLP